jgi:hypothetical protein
MIGLSKGQSAHPFEQLREGDDLCKIEPKDRHKKKT